MTVNWCEKSRGESMIVPLTLGSVTPHKLMSICRLTREYPSWLGIWSSLCRWKGGLTQSSILAYKNCLRSEWNQTSTRLWLFHHRWFRSVKITNDTRTTSSKSTALTKAAELAFWLSLSHHCLKYTPIQPLSSTPKTHPQASFIENSAKTEASFKPSNKVSPPLL